MIFIYIYHLYYVIVIFIPVPNDQLTAAQDAFRVILRQILKKLSEAGLSCDDTSTTAAPNVSVKQVGICTKTTYSF